MALVNLSGRTPQGHPRLYITHIPSSEVPHGKPRPRAKAGHRSHPDGWRSIRASSTHRSHRKAVFDDQEKRQLS